MARGRPDYSNPQYALAGTFADPAYTQIAALGAPSIDGLGRPIFAETFKGGLNAWLITNSGPAATISLEPTAAYIPPLRLHFVSLVPDVGIYPRIYRYLLLDNVGRAGIEFAFRIPTDNGAFSVNLACGDGSRLLSGRLRVARAAGTVEVYNGVSFDDVGWPVPTWNVGQWTVGKLVIDFSTGYFVRLQLANHAIDLSAYPLYIDDPSDGIFLYTEAGLMNENGIGDEVDIGLIIVTGDEP